MVIDIDKFLDEYMHGKTKDENVKKVGNKVDLNFQKEIEDRVYSVEKSSKNKEIKFLKKIYDEVKGFDEDLPNKFFGIGSSGYHALSNVGEQYSKNFLKITKNNISILTKRMTEYFDLLEKELSKKDFVKILEIYRKLLIDYNHYPKTFLVERVILGKKLRIYEIRINSLLREYKKDFVHDIKKKLFILMTKLKTSMLEKNILESENLINEVEYINNSIPKVLISNFTSEKVLISKVLIKAEEFLVNEYKKEFDLRMVDLDNLFDKFHSAYINKNLNKVLLIYNEIIANFKSLPEVFLEKKVEVYNKTNKLFDMVNKLIMNRNVFLFLESYEFGKKIEAFNEYLDHISLMSKVSAKSLLDIKKKIEDLPDKFYDEKVDLISKLKKIMFEKKKNNSISGLKTNEALKNIDVGKSVNIGVSDVVESPHIEIDVKKQAFTNFKKDLKEFEKVTDKRKILKLYKKIMFDLNRLGIDKTLRKKMILVLNKELHKKRLS